MTAMYSLLLLFCWLYTTSIKAYYVSLNTLPWQQAEDWCINHCNSHLATIQNEIQNTELQKLINYISKNVSNIYPVSLYFGLNNNGSNKYTYSDGSEPTLNWNVWSSSAQPTNGNYCVMMDANSDYQWITTECNNSSFIFACNHCDGVLTKYIIIDDIQTEKIPQQTQCESKYGTILGSIHSNNDMNEAKLLAQYVSDSTYIGLEREFQNFIWDDETELDYGNNFSHGAYPWGAGQPQFQQGCVILDHTDEYRWNDHTCVRVKGYYGLCSYPSEICNINGWSIINGTGITGWNWNRKPCQINNSYQDDNIAIIHGKRWNNDKKSFVLEYMYTINQGHPINGGTAGILFHFHTICANYYYIGISSGDSSVFLAEVKNNSYHVIIDKPLGFVYQLGIYYLLRVDIMNGSWFSISVNNVIYIDNYFSNLFNNNGNNVIGYVGIKNTLSSITAKSLFISGTMLLETNNDITKWFDACSLVTTSNPTRSPITNVPTTASPTKSEAVGTNTPTPSPTKDAVKEENAKKEEQNTTAFTYLSVMIVSVFILLGIIGYLDSTYWHRNDFFSIAVIISVMLQILDSLSDVFLAINLSFSGKVILFIASLIFIITPILLTMLQLIREIDKHWWHDDNIKLWLTNYSKLLYFMAIVTGSSFTAIHLMNSNLLSLETFSMGLSNKQIRRFQTNKVYSIVLVENLPQLLLQSLYLAQINGLNEIAICSMIFSSISIIVTIASMITEKKILNSQDYTVVQFEVSGSSVTKNADMYRNQVTTIRNQLSSVLGLNNKLIEVMRPNKIPNGLKITAQIHVNRIETRDIDYKKLLNDCQLNGNLAEIIKNAWKLNGTPIVSTITFQVQESNKNRTKSQLTDHLNNNVEGEKKQNNMDGQDVEGGNSTNIDLQPMIKESDSSITTEHVNTNDKL